MKLGAMGVIVIVNFEDFDSVSYEHESCTWPQRLGIIYIQNKYIIFGGTSMPTQSDEKKRIQVMMDKQLSDDVNDILSDLGLNPSIVMNALYHRIEAEGKIPFDLSLTDEERATHHLTSTIKSLDIPVIKDKKAAEKFLFGDDDEK